MSAELLLYTRTGCCLCDDMKEVIRQVAERFPIALREIDVDSDPDLQARYGSEVPVLFINSKKAFKYRMTARELEKRLRKNPDG